MRPLNLNLKDVDQVIELLKIGRIGVMPTDTIYGIIGSALNPKTVKEIYSLRSRSSDKPLIVLIASLEDLKRFGIALTQQQKDFLISVWPNPVSVILPCPKEEFSYLHRGKNSLAFRMPKHEQLLKVLKKTGPLVAPSANFENSPPAEDINQARKYFGNNIAFYVDGGTVKSQPSTVIQLYEDGTKIVLREGNYRV